VDEDDAGDADDEGDPYPPPGFGYLLRWFWSLSETRTRWEYGINPIQPTEIAAWCALCGEELEPWEVSMLLMMDKAYRSAVADAFARHLERNEGGTPGDAPGGRELTPELFDAVFG